MSGLNVPIGCGNKGYFSGTGSASTSGQYIGNAGTKAIGYFAQETNENLVIPSGLNAFSIESVVLNNGASITVEDGATYKVL